jgi:hypothetical protein
VQHNGIAASDAQVAKVIREFRYRIHTDTPKHPPQGGWGSRRFALIANCKQHQAEAGDDLSKSHRWKADVLQQCMTFREN